MNYIYNIHLNFKDKYYGFYEWNKKDPITHIHKIPIIKLSKNDLNNIKFNYIKMEQSISNPCIFASNQELVGIKFNKQGYSILKSDIHIEDYYNIINKIKKYKITKLKYKIIKKEKIIFKTRLERENKRMLLKEIKKIYMNKEYNKLNYIYMECFNNSNINTYQKYLKIKKEITNGNSNFYIINDILKLITKK